MQKDTYFLEANILPQVFDMSGIPMLHDRMRNDLSDILLTKDHKVLNELMDAMELLQQADNLGSIMKFDISEVTREIIVRRLAEYKTMGEMPFMIRNFLSAFRLLLALTDKYAAVVANPPYMGSGNMNPELAKYVKDNYEDGKADLFSVFMYVSMQLLTPQGKIGMINMQSWMFLSSFEKLRKYFIKNYQIDNMLHLGPRTFDELNGEIVQNTTFIVSNTLPSTSGIYYQLTDGKNCIDKKRMFLNKENQFTVNSQKEFEKIPGHPIAYWVSDKIKEVFTSNVVLSSVASPCVGLQTADNAKFLRLWFEVNLNRIGFECENATIAISSQKKWFPYNKGGAYRKWYGNQEFIINWENNGYEIKKTKGAVIRNPQFYFRESISWGLITSGGSSFRYYPKGFIYDVAGMSLFMTKQINQLAVIASLNTKLFSKLIKIINPTINMQCGDIAKSPYLMISSNYTTANLAEQNISISKIDWNIHETSWDFKKTTLLDTEFNKQESKSLLSNVYKSYCMQWHSLFMQLHRNEEELNRQFIEIYGLQDELTPSVPLEEITILQQGEITIKDNEITFNADVIMKQFISYAVGCWMGRYRLDRPGLQIAHPNPTEEETAPYPYNGEEFTIDDDAIIPFMSRDCVFDDNAVSRFTDFVRITFGAETLTENLNFIEESLGKTLEDYLVKDFWKDHKKMYQNRPIYWLFSSKKGAFQCITYMHRMDAYTVEKIRSKYLLPHIEYLSNRILEMENRAASLSTQERKKLDKLRKDLDECQEYHNRLHIIADEQIAFDLDDGVLVNHAKFKDVVAKIK